jgi:hypothetical protein
MVWGRVTLCRATHITWVSALGCLIIHCRPNSKANGLAMLKHLFPLLEYRSEATSGHDSQYLDGWPPYGLVFILSPRKQLNSCWLPVLYHICIVRNWSNALHYIRIVDPGRTYVCGERTMSGDVPARCQSAAQDVQPGLQPRRRAKVQIWIDPESPRG